MWEGFCGLSADRFSHRRKDTKPEDVREFLDAKKNQKSIRQYFKISAKKTILDPATVEYQLNDSFFLQFQ